MKLTIANRQRQARPNLPALRNLTRFFMERAGGQDVEQQWGNVVVSLVEHSGMRAANRAHFGIDDSTDVISVAYAPLPGEDGLADADVIVNVECAMAGGHRHTMTARSSDWSVDHELAFYLAHGVDHLSGADDATAVQRRGMHRREKMWIREAVAKGLLAGLLRPLPGKGNA